MSRDYVMARIAAAYTNLGNARTALDLVIEHSIDPDEDPKGTERLAALEESFGYLSEAAIAIQRAMKEQSDLDRMELRISENDLPDDEEDDDPDVEEEGADEDEES